MTYDGWDEESWWDAPEDLERGGCAGILLGAMVAVLLVLGVILALKLRG